MIAFGTLPKPFEQMDASLRQYSGVKPFKTIPQALGFDLVFSVETLYFNYFRKCGSKNKLVVRESSL